MAKTQQTAGTTTTSQPERLTLTGTPQWRSRYASADQRFINYFQETIKNEVTNSFMTSLVPRPGLSKIQAYSGTTTGLTTWKGDYYFGLGDKLFYTPVLSTPSSPVELLTFASTPQHIGFVEVTNAGVSYLFVCDGTNGYRIKADHTIEQVNVTYPTWVTLTAYNTGDFVIPPTANGYYYRTQNSGTSLDEPTWPTSVGTTVTDSFGIIYECMGEYGGFPTPHIPQPKFIDGYLLLVKSNTNEIHNSDVDNIFGWGAANFVGAEMWPDNIVAVARQNNLLVAFGTEAIEFFYDSASGTSPLARSESGATQIGCAAPWAIYEHERFCIFVGQSNSGGRAVWLIEGQQAKKISSEPIERVIDSFASLSGVFGYGLRILGHLFYILRLGYITLVYDVEEKVWCQWSSPNGILEHHTFKPKFVTDAGYGAPTLLADDGLYLFTQDQTTDDGVSIIRDIYTPLYDGNTMNRKFMKNLTLVCDAVASGFTVSWSDDDYQTFNTPIALTGRNFISRLGSFRRRAFHIRYLGTGNPRVFGLEFEVDVGTH